MHSRIIYAEDINSVRYRMFVLDEVMVIFFANTLCCRQACILGQQHGHMLMSCTMHTPRPVQLGTDKRGGAA
jgi:hypothetical protein